MPVIAKVRLNFKEQKIKRAEKQINDVEKVTMNTQEKIQQLEEK